MGKTIKILTQFLSNHWLFITISLAGLVLRMVQPQERFLYGHDQDLSAWFVKDIVVNHHIRLIGQETSTQGIFIGPLFYYLLVPFFLLFNMDPIGGVHLMLFIGAFSIFSIYFVISKIFTKNSAIIATLIYSISYYTVMNDREVVPTAPVIVWTVWFLYGLHLILKKKIKEGFILLGFLAGLIWHLNFALVLPFPLVILALVFAKTRIKFQNLIYGFLAFLLPAAPLFLFELRHNFPQSKALVVSLTTNQHDVVSGIEKLNRVILLMSKNIHSLFIGSYPGISYKTVLYVIILFFGYLLIKKVLSKKWAVILSVWILIYVVFFSLYSKIVSEYYLNGTIIVFISIASLTISEILKYDKIRHFGFIVLGLFSVFSVNKFITTPINESGYIQRNEIIGQIGKDAQERGYPCLSISYITDPGYNFGYRYFIYLNGIKTKPVSDKIPVYTIVYPLKPIFPVNTTRGSIGLIYPDYQIYNMDVIEENCRGENDNLSEPLWGFPQ